MGPDELCEIASWMPAKSTIKCSFLCKSLLNRVSEPDFIKKQCIHSFGQDDGLFLQPIDKPDIIPFALDFHALPSSASGIPSESISMILRYGRIVSSINGLLLLGRRTSAANVEESWGYNTSDVEFFVCNPATRKLAPLATPASAGRFTFLLDDDFISWMECYPPGHGDGYTIALVVAVKPDVTEQFYPEQSYPTYFSPYTYKKQLVIYSNGRWEEELCDVTVKGWKLRYDMPVAVFSEASRGFIVHYLCERPDYSSEPCIAAFDIRKKKLSRLIKLPEGAWDAGYETGREPPRDRLKIYKWNDGRSICLVKCYWREFNVWVLDQPCNSNSNSWRMVMINKGVEEILGTKLLSFREMTVVTFSVAGGNNLVLVTEKGVYAYGMEGENRGRLEVVGEHGFRGWERGVTIIPYANTLRSVSVK